MHIAPGSSIDRQPHAFTIGYKYFDYLFSFQGLKSKNVGESFLSRLRDKI